MGEHRDPNVLAGAGGQGHRAADHLVGLAGIDAEPHRQLDGLVELGGGQALHQVDGLRGEQLVAVEPLRRVGVLLSFRHDGSLWGLPAEARWTRRGLPVAARDGPR